MNSQLQQHVFISYVRENREQVDQFCQDLERHGVNVWLDRNNITPGIFWEDAIRKAIRNGAFFIACFSKEYNERTTTHMNEELNLAIEVLRKRPREQAWFIPVVLSGDVPDWEIFPGKTLQSIQWVPLYEDWEAGIQKILSVIKPIHQEVQNLISALRKYHDKALAADAFRIRRDRLSLFMEAYLTNRGKSDLFTDSEFYDACRRLAEMVSERDITLLIAKLYAEQLISSKERITDEKLPNNIPDLMLSYLNELNRNVPKEDRLENLAIHRYAKVLAWKSLKESFRPTSVQIDHALAVLVEEEGSKNLKYLEDKLHLIKTEQPSKDRFTFLLDPLAEYLAGLHLLSLHGDNKESWNNFIAEADSKERAPEAIKGFLLAVRDCIIAKGEEAKIPNFVEDELNKRVGFDPKALEKTRLKQRIQRLINQLGFPEVDDRDHATQALAHIGPKAVPALIEALKYPKRDIREQAARSLGKIGPGAKAARLDLIETLKDEAKEVRQRAAEALGEIDSEAKAAVPALMKVLKDKDEDVRGRAAQALGKIGPKAKAAVPALIKALKDQDEGVCQSAAEALGNIGSEAVPDLIKALKDKNRDVRYFAAWVLGVGNIGPEAKVAVPALIEALEDQDQGVRWQATMTLGYIGPEAKAAVPTLIEELKDENERIRETAARSLAKIVHRAKIALLTLIEALKDQDEDVLRSVAEALGAIGPEAVPALMEALNDKDENVRHFASWTLKKINTPSAQKAVEDFEQKSN